MNGRILISKLLSVHMPALNTQDMAKGQSIDICETNSKRRLLLAYYATVGKFIEKPSFFETHYSQLS